MNSANPKVDGYLRKARRWPEEMRHLRRIALDSGLSEDVKWRHPCYTLEKKNIVLIHGFNEYCAILFFKGALLKDRHKILVKPGENTQAARQIRFSGVQQVLELESVLKDYIEEAIEVEKAGLKVKLKKTAEYRIPPEFQKQLDRSSALKRAFTGLSPGRQRAYIFYFSSAKQSKTRQSRVEKSMRRILEGKGLDD